MPPANYRPSLSQILRLWAGKPSRFIPLLLFIIFLLFFLGPNLFHSGPSHFYDYGRLPPPVGHPHRPPARLPWSDGDTDEQVWPERALAVKKAFVHGYEGYRKNAFGWDELLPVTGGKVNNFNGWGVTMYDALDTMWIMGLDDYFNEAVDKIAKEDFMIKPNEFVPFFETVIRYLGGLLSAYALSGKPILLEKADELGRKLLPAFNTSSGFPMYAVNPQHGLTRGGWTGTTLWAEALSNQMEYKYLAHLTGKREYYDTVENVMKMMYNTTDGVFATQWNTLTGTPVNSQFSAGAFADSAHEYLLKQWLLTGKSEKKIRDLYLQASNAIIYHLLYIPPGRDFLYVTDTSYTSNDTSIPHQPSYTFEHLSCFLPGLFALGTETLSSNELYSEEREMHLWAAEGLAYACWLSYADQKSGLGPDEMSMRYWDDPTTTETANIEGGRVWVPKQQKGRWVDLVDEWKKKGKPLKRPPGLREVPFEPRQNQREYLNRKDTYMLRPEALESFYYLWRTTGDVRWRERGWAVFQSIEKYAKTEYGYASVYNVDSSTPALKDEMPSFFLAETLKYLYLLFTDEEIIPLDKWVFNTEAHPFPIFEWTKEEMERYGIS